MSSYKQLTQCQRYQIKALLKSGQNQTEIAQAIGVHKSTISRELKRNRGQRGYRPKQAEGKALSRRSWDRRRIKAETWAWVEKKIREDWSPEQVMLWMKTSRETSVSHEWIYHYIYADKRGVAIFISTCGARKSAVNGMEATIVEGRYPTG